MAVNFDEPIKRSGEEWRPFPEQLVISPELNGRHDPPDIEPLLQSIRQLGQLQLCLVRREGGKMVLAAGFRRWCAIRIMNERGYWKEDGKSEPYRVRCSFNEMSEKQAFLANISENHCRKETTPMDDAYNIQRLYSVYQMSDEEVCAIYQENVVWIKGRLQLIEATPALEKVIRSGSIKATQAKVIAKLAKGAQERLAAIAEAKGKVTAEDIAQETGKPAKKRPTDVQQGIGLPEKPRRVVEPPAPQETVSHAPVPAPQTTAAPVPATNGNGCDLLKLKAIGFEMARSILDDNMEYERQSELAMSFYTAAGVKYIPAKA